LPQWWLLSPTKRKSEGAYGKESISSQQFL